MLFLALLAVPEKPQIAIDNLEFAFGGNLPFGFQQIIFKFADCPASQADQVMVVVVFRIPPHFIAALPISIQNG